MQIDRRHVWNAPEDEALPRPASIPLRASAHPEAVVKVRPKYTRTYDIAPGEDISRYPTAPTVWQYETPRYEAESSLPNLSLVEAEMWLQAADPVLEDEEDTHPALIARKAHKVLPSLSGPLDLAELDTLPPPPSPASEQRPNVVDIADIPTQPSGVPAATRTHPVLPLLSAYKEQLSQVLQGDRQAIVWRFNALDRLRWWLLCHGRLESLLRISGTLILVCVTVVLLLATALSLGVHPAQTGPAQGTTPVARGGASLCDSLSTASNDMRRCVVVTAMSPEGLQIALFTTGSFVAGTEVHLQGHGFTALGRVAITHDNQQPCQPAEALADPHGEFTLTLALGDGADWQPGNHRLFVEDTVSRHSVMLEFLLNGPQTPPLPTITPTTVNVTPTASSTGGGAKQPPATQGPVVPPPTVIAPPPTVAAPPPTPEPPPARPAPPPPVPQPSPPASPPAAPPMTPVPTASPPPAAPPKPAPPKPAPPRPTPPGRKSPTADPTPPTPLPTLPPTPSGDGSTSF